MDVIDQLQAVKHGKLSRRAFNNSLMAAGVGVVAGTLPGRGAQAQAADRGTYFTFGGYDIPELFVPFHEKHGEYPNLIPFSTAEAGLVRMQAGFEVDVTHPCNSSLPRWIETGIFQPIDTGRLSNWPDVIPELVSLEGNEAPGGQVWMAPFDWGQNSITYRTDLVDLEGAEESWDILWDERFAGRIGMMSAAGESFWIGAIKAGVPFEELKTEEGLARTAEALRQQRPLVRTYTDDVSSLEQALASGELVAALTWNSSASLLRSQGVPVRFANPREGAMTWVCGASILRDAPNLDRAYDIVDSLLSVESGEFMIGVYGYGHANMRSFDGFTDEELEDLGLSRDPATVLAAGQFQIPMTTEWMNESNELWEAIKAGF
ncbi:MAG: extracellular solute-binding protein [Rubellimicrobium sp.]|nr:extracellular solute-binding protein [Rubellimicrobium sp.]